LTLEKHATRIRARAIRRAGELLAQFDGDAVAVTPDFRK
jgi:hypothetical protein